ncbi:hypothetical protein ANO11243_029930 [Dothideomycetidae sp. 11243]|nr:hypothetical protein ANO11243_029930 [fungal sp. No.11243]
MQTVKPPTCHGGSDRARKRNVDQAPPPLPWQGRATLATWPRRSHGQWLGLCGRAGRVVTALRATTFPRRCQASGCAWPMAEMPVWRDMLRCTDEKEDAGSAAAEAIVVVGTWNVVRGRALRRMEAAGDESAQMRRRTDSRRCLRRFPRAFPSSRPCPTKVEARGPVLPAAMPKGSLSSHCHLGACKPLYGLAATGCRGREGKYHGQVRAGGLAIFGRHGQP